MTGADVPDAVGTFEQLSLSHSLPRYIVKNVEAMGYLEPTPIQMQAIPLMLHVSFDRVWGGRERGRERGMKRKRRGGGGGEIGGGGEGNGVNVKLERLGFGKQSLNLRDVKCLPVLLLALERQLPSSYQFSLILRSDCVLNSVCMTHLHLYTLPYRSRRKLDSGLSYSRPHVNWHNRLTGNLYG